MTTLSTEDNTRPGADDRHPDDCNPVIEAMENPGNTSSHRVSGSLSNSHSVLFQEQAHTLCRGLRGGREDMHASSEARRRGYDSRLSGARGTREFFRDLGDLDYHNRHRPVATVEPLL